MAKFTDVEEVVESRSEKRVRIFLVVLFFIQTFMTTGPFMHGEIEEGFAYISAFNMLVQPNGYGDQGDIMLAAIGAVLVVLPIISFFFCLLDKKSLKKYVVSGVTSVACAVVITFGIGGLISFFGVITLIFNVVALFMTMQGVQAVKIRRNNTN